VLTCHRDADDFAYSVWTLVYQVLGNEDDSNYTTYPEAVRSSKFANDYNECPA